MAFAQLTYRESLRDIEACLRSLHGKLYRMGFRGGIARSTLADANELRDWRNYADFALVLIGIARPASAAALADLAKKRPRGKIPELRQALEGRQHHRFLLAASLGRTLPAHRSAPRQETGTRRSKRMPSCASPLSCRNVKATFISLGADYFARVHKDWITRHYLKRLRQLGQEVRLVPRAATA